MLATVGSLAAAATTGALIAFGRRLGSAALPFAATGAALLRETASAGSSGLIATGLVIHLVGTALWSAAFLWLVRARGWRAMPAAFAIAVLAHVVSWITAWTTGSGAASVLPLGDRLVLAAILAVALVVGIRLALSPPQRA